MHPVIQITGQVKYTIQLDPTIWILDERRFPLQERIPGTEGFAMELAPFLDYAEPSVQATHVLCHRSQGEPQLLTFAQTRSALLCFAQNNQPIRAGGPALLYLADGSNQENPIDYLQHLEVQRID